MKITSIQKSITSGTVYCKIDMVSTEEFIPPRCRNSGTLTTINNQAFLIGGFSNKLHNEIYVFSFDLCKWQIADSSSNGVVFKPRFGHSAAKVPSGEGGGSKIVVYGGEENIDPMISVNQKKILAVAEKQDTMLSKNTFTSKRNVFHGEW